MPEKTGNNIIRKNSEKENDIVSAAGLDEAAVRAYIRHQESEEERHGQMKFGV